MIILTMLNRNYKNNFDDELAIYLVNKIKNFILDKNYFEFKKFKDSYMRYFYSNNILLYISYVDYSGEYHREDGPAYIRYHNGEIYKKEYCLNGIEYSYEDYLLEIKKIV